MYLAIFGGHKVKNIPGRYKMVTHKRISFGSLVIGTVKVQFESYSKHCCITPLKGKHINSVSCANHTFNFCCSF